MERNRTEGIPGDAELVRLLLEGGQQAMDALVARYFGMVYAIALAHLRDREAAEDLAQEVFLRVYLSLDQLQNPVTFPAWITRITRNLACDWLRRGERSSRVVPMVAADGTPRDIPDTKTRGARETMEAQEENRALYEAIDRLPAEQREIILLHFMEEMTQEEIAEQLGVHRSSISRHLGKAMSALQAALVPMLRNFVPTLRPPKDAVARTTALLGAAAVLTASQKTAIAAAAGLAAQIGAAAPTAAAGTTTLLSGSSKTLLSTLSTGGKIVALKEMIAVVAVAAAIGGGAYYVKQHQKEAPAQVPAAQRDNSWRTQPVLSRVLSARSPRHFRWDGKIEQKNEPPSEDERKKLLVQFESQRQSIASLPGDEATRAQNLAAVMGAQQQVLSGSSTVSTFTLQCDGTGYLLKTKKVGEEAISATAATPEYTDSITIVPTGPTGGLGLERRGPGGSVFGFGIDWVLGLEHMAKLYENRVTATGDAQRCSVTFSNGAVGPRLLHEIRWTYDVSVSTLFPVMIETLASGGRLLNTMSIVSGQPSGAPSGIIPTQISSIHRSLDGSVHSTTTVTVELVDYTSPVDLEALTVWPARTTVNDHRFDTKDPVQYEFRPGMTEEEILREARMRFGPTTKRLGAR